MVEKDSLTVPRNTCDTTREIVFCDGSHGLKGDFPVAVVYSREWKDPSSDTAVSYVVDPIFSDMIRNNLYGRIMTLVEATTDMHKLKAVKDLFSKEIMSWSTDVYESARELSTGGDSSSNLYTKLG